MGELSPVARVRAWLASPEAADAVLPTLVFQAALHLFALLSAAAAASSGVAATDSAGPVSRFAGCGQRSRLRRLTSGHDALRYIALQRYRKGRT